MPKSEENIRSKADEPYSEYARESVPPPFALAKFRLRLYNTSTMAEGDDRKLIKKCLEGDAEAWSEFVDRFSGLIYWVIKRKLCKYYIYMESDVEEIYQRVLASIWEKKSLTNVSERGNISPWIAVLASNLTIDFVRKKTLEEDFLREGPESESRPQRPDEGILDREDKRLLDEAIKLLNKKERAFLELNYIAGKKQREIAGIFNMKINSVSTIITRAKNKIKRYIESKQ